MSRSLRGEKTSCGDAMREEVPAAREDLLEREIVLRLYHAGCAAGGPSPSPRKRAKFWRAQAREVLRLMEWSRRDLANQLDAGRSNPIVTPSLKTLPLTLPPEDWKP